MSTHHDDTLTDVPVEHLLHAADYFEHLPQPAVVFNRRDKLVACNRAAADLHGIAAADVPGLDLFPFFPPEAADQLARGIHAARTGGGWQGELPILTAGYDVRTAQVKMAVIGEQMALLYTNVAARPQGRRVGREATRWAATRDLAVAVVDSLPAPEPEWAEQVRAFVVGSATAVESVIDHGVGRTVLVAGFHPVVRKVLEAFLERCDYLTVSADHPTEGSDLLVRHRERVRAVVLGPEADADTLDDLHRFRPLLPAVLVGWANESGVGLPYPAQPTALVRAVAEAVAADQEHDALTDEVEIPNFIVT